MTKSPTGKRLETKFPSHLAFNTFLFLACALLVQTACGGGGTPLSVSPNSSMVQSAQTLQFTAKFWAQLALPSNGPLRVELSLLPVFIQLQALQVRPWISLPLPVWRTILYLPGLSCG